MQTQDRANALAASEAESRLSRSVPPRAPLIATACMLALGCALPAACSRPPPRLVIRAGRLLDGSGAPAREHIRVFIERGNITSVEADDGAPLASTPEVQVIDARTSTVLPGLVGMRTSLFAGGRCPAGGSGLAASLRDLGRLVAAGFTTVAEADGPLTSAIGLRRFVGTGRGRGPRLLVTGPSLLVSTTGGDSHPGGEGSSAARGGSAAAAGDAPAELLEAARSRVRKLAEGDIDVLSIRVRDSEVGLSHADAPTADTALCAIIEEAHTQKLLAWVEPGGHRASSLALDCHADALVRTTPASLPIELLTRAAGTRLVVAPQLTPVSGKDADAAVASDTKTGGADATAVATADYTAALRRMQVPVAFAFGTDCIDQDRSPAWEIERLVGMGMPPAEALAAATAGSARLLGLGDALGRIQTGYRADLIAVGGRPDEQIESIEHVQTVVIDGIVQPLDGSPWWAWPAAAASIVWAHLAG